MAPLRELIRHPLAGSALRFGITGATVAGVYLAIPLFLSGVLGVPIQVAIPIGYVLAVTLHFNLQRHFVFRHVEQFALSTRQQIARYVAIGAVQYPTTALGTALLPSLLGISERVTFVAMTVSISVSFFLILRGHVFHEHHGRGDGPTASNRQTMEERLLDVTVLGQPEADRDSVQTALEHDRKP